MVIFKLGQMLAQNREEDCEDWEVDDFGEYYQYAVLDEGKQVRRASWSGGSSAGIYHFDGYFFAYDDAGFYGPHKKYQDAEASIDLTDKFDLLIEDWTDSEFKSPHKGEE